MSDVELELKRLVRDVPDYPKPGIVFKDITPVLANAQAFARAVEALALPFVGQHIDAVLGISLGSVSYAVASRTFRWEGFAGAEDTANHVIGGILMGFGGVTALGCTIGQGLTGFSTLAVGSMLAFLAIVAGSAVTMKWQYWRMSRE